MATQFSLRDPNPGVYFSFNDDDTESGGVLVRSVNMTKRNEIQKKTVKNRVEYKHGQRFEYTETNEDLFSELLWDYAIAGWERLEDDDKNPIECTTENKLFLMRNNVGFAQFVGQCMEKLEKENEKRLKVVEKNSLPGSKESGKSPIAKPVKS